MTQNFNNFIKILFCLLIAFHWLSQIVAQEGIIHFFAFNFYRIFFTAFLTFLTFFAFELLNKFLFFDFLPKIFPLKQKTERISGNLNTLRKLLHNAN